MKTLMMTLLLMSSFVKAEVVFDTLYVNSGCFISETDSFPYISFNKDSLFSTENSIISKSPYDTLILYLINNDSVDHSFEIANSSFLLDVPSHQIKMDSIFGLEEGVHLLNSVGDYSKIGLSTILKVENESKVNFYWNLKDFNDSLSFKIRNEDLFDQTAYKPNYFLINGKLKSLLESDTLASVSGRVGDTIYINIVNTGQAYHSIHFHGYHCSIMYSGLHKNYIGREKDTFLMEPYERYILRLVPDKPGDYPVHDHNLVAVSKNRVYPSGMFMMMKIYN